MSSTLSEQQKNLAHGLIAGFYYDPDYFWWYGGPSEKTFSELSDDGLRYILRIFDTPGEDGVAYTTAYGRKAVVLELERRARLTTDAGS